MIGARRKFLIFGVTLILLVSVVIAVLVLFVLQSKESEEDTNNDKPGAGLGRYKKAAVATNGQECAQIGADMLAKDGSAVDAAIASLLCEGVASLHSMGLGGGFLMTIWDAETKTASYLDARETAPAKAHRDMFDGNADRAMYGGLAVAVPGELLGYWEAHKKYGKLPWSDLFKPTIELCKIGSRVNHYLARYLAQKEKMIKAEESLAEILINPKTNSVWKEGDRIRRPQLAITLKEIADRGPKVFYNGTMADNLVREIQEFGGIIQKTDLQNYRVNWTQPIISKVRELTVLTPPPPGSGAILTFIMNVLNGLIPVTNDADDKIMWQYIVETFKWAYARRTELGDPHFVNIEPLLKNLTSSDYAYAIRSAIKYNETSNDPRDYGAITVNPDDSGTSHVSVLAPDGSAVSVTSTINQVFGAMIRSKSTGIIFNDEMDDFSSPNITNSFDIPASPANFIIPGKRPLSSMSPTIILDENQDVRLVIGAAGGTKITSGVAIGMILHLWYDYDIKQAVDAFRIHHQLFPMAVQNEEGFSPEILDFLSKIGHNVTTYTGIGSAITAVAKNNSEITANSDYRREGRVAGF